LGDFNVECNIIYQGKEEALKGKEQYLTQKALYVIQHREMQTQGSSITSLGAFVWRATQLQTSTAIPLD
jgi:hypothetical protein